LVAARLQVVVDRPRLLVPPPRGQHGFELTHGSSPLLGRAEVGIPCDRTLHCEARVGAPAARLRSAGRNLAPASLAFARLRLRSPASPGRTGLPDARADA